VAKTFFIDMKFGTNCKQILIRILMPTLFLATGAVSGIAYERYWHREECLKMAYDNSGGQTLSDQEIGEILKTLNSGEESNLSSADQSDNYQSPETTGQESQNFVGSRNSNKFYPVNCHYAQRIKEENKVFFASREEGEKQGRTYVECN